MPATLTFKLIVAYLNDPQCNNLSGEDDKWVINENIIFDYLVSVDLFKFIDNSSLHMPLSMLSMTSTPVERGEGSIFVIPLSKKSKLPTVFGRVQPRMSAVTNSSSDSKPSQIFHYA